MEVIVAGINHKSASLDIRECLAITHEDMPTSLHTLKNRAGLDEVVIVSTCNRIEVYAAVKEDASNAPKRISYSNVHSSPSAHMPSCVFITIVTPAESVMVPDQVVVSVLQVESDARETRTNAQLEPSLTSCVLTMMLPTESPRISVSEDRPWY